MRHLIIEKTRILSIIVEQEGLIILNELIKNTFIKATVLIGSFYKILLDYILFVIRMREGISMKGKFGSFISICFLLVVFFCLSTYELKSIKVKFIQILWGNISFILSIAFTLLPFLVFILIFVFIVTRKWAFRVEKLSIGGFNIIFDNPDQLFKRQMRTFLDTKRTLFTVDFEHDNFEETLNSYYETYKLLRDEIKILGDAKKKKNKGKKSKETERLYDLSNEMIKELNEFLTKHQSNYRRWYKYMEKNEERKFYLEPIGNFQKDYQNYGQLCYDFKSVNKFFIEEVATEFNINIEKWGI
ncbi:hypothetical protein [Bacillus mycoides]|uniref:hypothetical protein n=2 Tax=Bacillus mycoides TaxID=1405 RepID=UPI003D1E2410